MGEVVSAEADLVAEDLAAVEAASAVLEVEAVEAVVPAEDGKTVGILLRLRVTVSRCLATIHLL